jgi:hypothetical protein
LFIYQKKQITYLKNIEVIKSEYEKNLLNTQLEIQEQTLQTISREIHDHICLNLTLAKLNLITLDNKNKKETTDRINSSIDILGRSIHELSDISHSMNPEIIESQGLIKALELEIEKIRKPGLFNIQFHINGNPVFMDSQKELFIFRIIQETFNNILKHAKAKNASLQLYYNINHLEATVKDDGVGFNWEYLNSAENKKQHSGLNNITKRINLINGTCEINSIPGEGTTIHLSIPY